MGMVDRKWGLEEIPVSRVSHIFGIIFLTGYGDLTVLWLTRELACSYFVAFVVRLALHITV